MATGRGRVVCPFGHHAFMHAFPRPGRSVLGAVLIAVSFGLACFTGLIVLMIRVDREVTAVEMAAAIGLPLATFSLGVYLWTSGWLRLARRLRENSGA
jgi:hypothetical protein